MRSMNSLEYSFLATELASRLVGKHYNRLRKISEGKYRLKIGTTEIVAEGGIRLNATRYVEESQSDKFTEKVDKELDGSRLAAVEQLNGDRILSFVFDRGRLVFEMFGEGNVVLVRDGKTVCAERYESWSDREIKAGAEYRTPKTAPSPSLEVSDKYIIVSMMRLPLGKEYALEALSRAGVDEKAPGKSLSGNKLNEIELAVKAIRDGAKPYGFFREGKLIDFALAPLARYFGLEARGYPTISEAADEFYAHAEKPNPKLEKLLERLSKQKERLETLAAEGKELKEKGDFVYGHYQEAEEILSLAKAGKFEELEKRYGAKIDRKERSVEADLQ